MRIEIGDLAAEQRKQVLIKYREGLQEVKNERI